MHGDFRLGQWLVRPQLNTVQADGRTVRLEPKFMQVLTFLATRPGEVIPKEELIRHVWTDTFVTDDVLTRAISELRRALGDDARQPHLIETVSRGGYRLMAPVEGAAESPVGGVGSRLTAKHKAWLATGLALAALAVIVAFALRRKPPDVQISQPHPIAVLPLQNTSAAKDFDFLCIGLADDISNTLSYYPALSMRPFSASNRYAGADVDLQKAARELRVADIVTGHFAVAGDAIEVTLEAVDATNNRVLWRGRARGTTRDLIGIQQQIAASVQQGLIAALGATAGQRTSKISPNAEAYELYLRAVSEDDPASSPGSSFSASNKNSIRLLQRAVAIDPGYASAWAELGHLNYYEIGFGAGGEAAKLRAKAALQRAVALDPDRIDAATDLINMESEEGDLNQAYDDIVKLLHQRPDSGAAHLVYSYVLWYAGLLNDSASECEKARSIDAGTTDLASCFFVFAAMGRYQRAREYLQLVSGTEYEKSGKVEIFLREGKPDEALQELKGLPPTPLYGQPLLEPCLQHRPPGVAAASASVQELRSGLMADDDPGPKYLIAAWDSMCGQTDLSFRELHKAIEQNYCAYPQMETDPLLANLRATPKFEELRSMGMSCQQRFLAHRNKADLK